MCDMFHLDRICSSNSALDSKHFQGHRRRHQERTMNQNPQDCPRTLSTCYHGPRYTIVAPWLVTATAAPNRFFPTFQFKKGLAGRRGNHWVCYLPSLHSHPLTNLQRSPATVFFSDVPQYECSDILYTLFSHLSSLKLSLSGSFLVS